jgi:hypothetical protein
MGLAIWNLISDRYNHDQQADNMAKIDFHDHSPGRGIQIGSEGIKDGAITAIKIAPGADSIQNGSITTLKFASLPGAKVYKSSVTTLANGIETTLTFDSEHFDNSNLHDTGVNTNRLTIPAPGIYMITSSIQTNATPLTGILRLAFYKNGIVDSLARSSMSPNAVSHTLTSFVKLVAGDYVVARVLNTTGASVNILAGTAGSESLNDFGAVWLTP